MDDSFWKGKSVLVTGHTGFKGSWLCLWLQEMGASVVGISLDPPTEPSLYQQAKVADDMLSLRQDIREAEKLIAMIDEYQPEIVFHLAAQPLVRYSYREPIETYATNVMGTLHVLEGIRQAKSVRAAVLITTDKCYENREWDWGYRENEAMGGHDPYSSSKGCAELLIASYRNSYFHPNQYPVHKTAIASARAGNVIGGGDWAEDRLIPDIIRAFQSQESVLIRNPHAIRPWQHVLEPLSGYIELAERLYSEGVKWAEAWNFGPNEADARSVEWIVMEMCEFWGGDSSWTLDDGDHPHEAHYLKLDCSKAHTRLHWWPRWSLKNALQKIVDWHKAVDAGEESKALCLQQIRTYMKSMEQ